MPSPMALRHVAQCACTLAWLLLLAGCKRPASQATWTVNTPSQAHAGAPVDASNTSAQPTRGALSTVQAVIDLAPERTPEGCGIQITPGYLEGSAQPAPVTHGGAYTDVLELEGCHTLVFSEMPWWLAEGSVRVARPLQVGLDIQRYAGSENSGPELRHAYHAWLSLRLPRTATSDAPSESTLWHVVVHAHADGSLSLSLAFRDSHLHTALDLPWASDGFSRAEPLALSLTQDAHGIRGQLSSLRSGVLCEVLRLESAPKTPPCTLEPDFAGLSQARSALHARITPWFTPHAALEALRQNTPTALHWGDDGFPLLAAADHTGLEMRVRPLGFACQASERAEDLGPTHTSRSIASEVPLRVWIPVEITLKTQDGRLDLTLSGGVRTQIQPGVDRWDRRVTLEASSEELSALLHRGQRPGFALPKRALAFASLALELDSSGLTSGQLALRGIMPYPRAPSFPARSGARLEQARCFGEEAPEAFRQAELLWP